MVLLVNFNKRLSVLPHTHRLIDRECGLVFEELSFLNQKKRRYQDHRWCHEPCVFTGFVTNKLLPYLFTYLLTYHFLNPDSDTPDFFFPMTLRPLERVLSGETVKRVPLPEDVNESPVVPGPPDRTDETLNSGSAWGIRHLPDLDDPLEEEGDLPLTLRSSFVFSCSR